jgi:hypothetical protein
LTPTPSHRRWNSIALDPLNTIEMKNHLPGLRHPKHHKQESGTWVHKYMEKAAKPRKILRRSRPGSHPGITDIHWFINHGPSKALRCCPGAPGTLAPPMLPFGLEKDGVLF